MGHQHTKRQRTRMHPGLRATQVAVAERPAHTGHRPRQVPTGARRESAAHETLPSTTTLTYKQLPTPVTRLQRVRHHLRLGDPWMIVALAITMGAFVLREAGAAYGLPYQYNWDEPSIVNRAIHVGSGDLNPHGFIYPGLLIYVTFIAEAGLFLVGRLLHVYPSVNAFAAAYFTNATPFYVVARTLSALAGAGCVVLCYMVGRRFFTPLIGVLAALLLAVSPAHVINSHIMIPEVPMTFFVMLSLVFVWNVYAHGRRRDYLLAGVAIGLGIATKYLPAILLVSLALAHLFRIYHQTGRWWPRRAELVPLAMSVGAALLTFCVTSPYNILAWREATQYYSVQTAVSTAGGSTSAPFGFGSYVTFLLPWSLGWPVYLAALGGLVAILRTHGERRRQLILLASYPILFFVIISSARQAPPRYMTSLQPFLALSAAAIVAWCASQAPQLVRRLRPQLSLSRTLVGSSALATAMAILLVPPVIATISYDSSLSYQDTRTQALAWFEVHVPSGTNIALQPLFGRYFETAPIMTQSQLEQLVQQIPAGKTAVRQQVDAYYHARPLYPDVPFDYDLAHMRAEGVRYVVLSSAEYHQSGDGAVEDRFYAALRRVGHVVAQFSPPVRGAYAVEMPTITIYALS